MATGPIETHLHRSFNWENGAPVARMGPRGRSASCGNGLSAQRVRLRSEINHHKGACPLCGGGALGEELHRGVVGGVLVDVVEGLERQQSCGLRIAAALEGVGNEPVGKLGVLGQCRSV